jgi:hypothetical protein
MSIEINSLGCLYVQVNTIWQKKRTVRENPMGNHEQTIQRQKGTFGTWHRKRPHTAHKAKMMSNKGPTNKPVLN